MNTERLLRDLKAFALVTLFYLLLLAAICAVRAWRKGGSSWLAELRLLLRSKNFTWVYSAIYLFTTMYAVKNVVARIILMFIYLGLVIKLVKADLDSRKR